MFDVGKVSFGSEISAAAKDYHLDPALLAAVAAQETGGPGSSSGRNIVGDGGHGHGVFQIDDRSWAFARTAAAMNPAQNAKMAASILADNLNRYGGDVRKALSAYNSGSPTATGTTTTWADGTTLGYADSVLRHFADLGGDATPAQLVADNRETSGTVNALASYSSAALPPTAAPGALGPNPYAASSGFPPSTSGFAGIPGANLPAPSAAQSPFTAARSYASLLPQGSSDPDGSGETADSAMADLVGGGDVFDS